MLWTDMARAWSPDPSITPIRHPSRSSYPKEGCIPQRLPVQFLRLFLFSFILQPAHSPSNVVAICQNAKFLYYRSTRALGPAAPSPPWFAGSPGSCSTPPISVIFDSSGALCLRTGLKSKGSHSFHLRWLTRAFLNGPTGLGPPPRLMPTRPLQPFPAIMTVLQTRQ